MIKIKCRGYEGALIHLSDDSISLMRIATNEILWRYNIEIKVAAKDKIVLENVNEDEIEFLGVE